MPLYMDRHDIEGVTAQAVAEAHEKDLSVQDKNGVKYHNYWCDQSRGCVFCLVEAPTKEAALQVHREAHGLLPNEIIEVDPKTVKAFFGDLTQSPPLLAIVPCSQAKVRKIAAFARSCSPIWRVRPHSPAASGTIGRWNFCAHTMRLFANN
jgi:hypothetical protein